jgi:hypothetical protein
MEELGFQLLDRGDWTLLQAGKMESAGSLCSLGVVEFLVLPTEQQVVIFFPSIRNLAFLLFNVGMGALPLSGTVGSAGPLSTLRMYAFWCYSLSSSVQLSLSGDFCFLAL